MRISAVADTNSTVVQEMKILAATLFVLFVHIACGDEVAKKPLHLRIKDAVTAGTPIDFGSEHKTRTITFVDGERRDKMAMEPIFFSISEVIWRIEYPKSREVNLKEAKQIYQSYAAVMKKVGGKPELELWLSKESDAKLLTHMLEVAVPDGKGTVSIRYFDSSPRRIDPVSIHKLIPPDSKK